MDIYIRIYPVYIHTHKTFKVKFIKFYPETSGHFSKLGDQKRYPLDTFSLKTLHFAAAKNVAEYTDTSLHPTASIFFFYHGTLE